MFLTNIDQTEPVETYINLHKNKPPNLQIDADIPRTFSDKHTETKFIGALKRILYATSSLEIEYIQGMNFIVQHLMVFCAKSLNIEDQ